jgi:pepsin A
MFPSSALLSLLLFVVSGANATPIRRDSNTYTLSLASKINTIAGQTLADIDRARASALLNNVSGKKNGKRSDKPVFVATTAVSYTASVGVGSPATECESSVSSSIPLATLKLALIRYVNSRHWQLQYVGGC